MFKNRHGRVKWFQNNVGFIKDDESGEDFFFHWSDIAMPDETGYYILYPRDLIIFDIVDTGNKIKATNIRSELAISTNGKPLVKIIYLGKLKNLRVAEFNIRFLSKTQYGIKYLNLCRDKIFGSSEPISERDMEEVYNFSLQHERKFCSTEGKLSFDIIFI